MAQLGKYLQKLRGKTPLRKVAEATGIHFTTLRDYEEGKIFPSKEILRALAEFFDVPYQDFRVLYYRDTVSEDSDELAAVLQFAKEEMDKVSKN